MKNVVFISKELEKHWYEVDKKNMVFLAVQGSWNYNLGYEGSDVDTKAFLIPTFRDFVKQKKPISTTHVLKNDEHCDLKDIRVYFDEFWKQNINFLEVLFTPYFMVRPKFSPYLTSLFSLRERIARYNNYRMINAIYGMAVEKQKALERPYPSVMEKIEKYGYDAKQLHHILRLEEFMSAYVSDYSFKECLTHYRKYGADFLIDVKSYNAGIDVERARELSNDSIKVLSEMRQNYMDAHKPKIDYKVKDEVEEILYECLKDYFKEELLGD